jgi:hypothetical protein
MDYSSVNQWDVPFDSFPDEIFGGNHAGTSAMTQFPTPRASEDASPAANSVDTDTSVSTVFHPGAVHPQLPADLILLSCDSVLFYVHSQRLIDASFNGFNSYLPRQHSQMYPSDLKLTVIVLPESSEVLGIVLHTLYMMSCSHFCPTSEIIVQAVQALKTYGTSIKDYTAPSMPLYQLILSRAPLYPVELYAVASENDLLELATAISPHLLGYDLSSLTDVLCLRIGATYLKRLFFLHLGRSEALKRLLVAPPALHGPTADCDFAQQKKLTRAWTLAAAYLAWDPRPDLSTSTIEYALGSLDEYLTCGLCQQALQIRIKQLVIGWASIKRTI